MKSAQNCESCSRYSYDEDYDCYECDMHLDQDEMARFLEGHTENCPYYSYAADYELARRQ